MDMTLICKACKKVFQEDRQLIYHLNDVHKDKHCANCKSKIAEGSESYFCETCLKLDTHDMRQIGYLNEEIQKLEEQIEPLLRELQLKRSQRYELKKKLSPAIVNEFCGHGRFRNACIQCDPIWKDQEMIKRYSTVAHDIDESMRAKVAKKLSRKDTARFVEIPD